MMLPRLFQYAASLEESRACASHSLESSWAELVLKEDHEDDSIGCRWWGKTEISSNSHKKMRVFKAVYDCSAYKLNGRELLYTFNYVHQIFKKKLDSLIHRNLVKMTLHRLHPLIFRMWRLLWPCYVQNLLVLSPVNTRQIFFKYYLICNVWQFGMLPKKSFVIESKLEIVINASLSLCSVGWLHVRNWKYCFSRENSFLFFFLVKIK